MNRSKERTNRPAMSSVYSRRRNDGKLKGLIARMHRLDAIRNALYAVLGLGMLYLIGTVGGLEQDVIGDGEFLVRSIAGMLVLAVVMFGLAHLEGKSAGIKHSIEVRRRELRDIYR